MKKAIHIAIECLLLTVIVLFALMVVVEKKKSSEKDKTILMMADKIADDDTAKYKFLDYKVSKYIESLCSELELDSDLAVAILMVENPKFDDCAVNRNLNGTVDCGLFQLNDRYIWTVFKESYWIEGVELDPFNWRHNCFIAVHHIDHLTKKLKVVDDAIRAYNCGAGAVMNGNVPQSTELYLAKVKNNLRLLKSANKE